MSGAYQSRAMAQCNTPCRGNPDVACGGTNRIIIYENLVAEAIAYNSYSTTYLATPPAPTYSCLPASKSPFRVAST